MALTAYYSAGTATLTNGSAAVVGVGTAWTTNNLAPGDQIESDAGERATILTIDGPTSLTLDKPFAGTAQATAPYKIWRTFDAQYLMEGARNAFSLLGSGSVGALAQLVIGAANTLLKSNGVDLEWAPAREFLTVARTYYVRPDGNDGNTGRANTSVGAFLTIQKAIDVAASLDTSIYDVTIRVAAGTYDIGNVGLVAKPCVGGGAVIVIGDEVAPANVKLRTTGVLSGNVACVISQNLSTIYKVRGVRFESTATGNAFGLMAVGSSRIEFQNIDLGTGLLQHLRAEDGGLLVATGPYAVSGSTQAGGFHWAVVGGAVIRVQAKTVTFSGAVAFGTFALATTGSIMFVNGNTFAGTAGAVTGTRYLSDGNSIISTAGGGSTYLPGSVAGAETNGGRYV